VDDEQETERGDETKRDKKRRKEERYGDETRRDERADDRHKQTSFWRAWEN
jgi:hypothetical protein